MKYQIPFCNTLKGTVRTPAFLYGGLPGVSRGPGEFYNVALKDTGKFILSYVNTVNSSKLFSY